MGAVRLGQGARDQRAAAGRARTSSRARRGARRRSCSRSCFASTSTLAPSARSATCISASAASRGGARRAGPERDDRRQDRPWRHPRDRVPGADLLHHARRPRSPPARRATVATLQIVARLGLLPADEAQRLIDHYRFLRRLEHALQYRDDAQTHALPPAPADRAAVASLLGLPWRRCDARALRSRGADVMALLRRDVSGPAGRARRPAAGRRGRPPPPAGAPLAQRRCARRLCRCAGQRRAADSTCWPRRASRRCRWRRAPRRAAGRPGAAAHRRPRAPARRRGGPVPTRSCCAGCAWSRSSAGAAPIFRCWPSTRRRTSACWACWPAAAGPAEYLLQHPILLDELIDLRGAEVRRRPPGRRSGCATGIGRAVLGTVDRARSSSSCVQADADVERQMNILRDAHHAQVFRLLLADLAGNVRLERLADHLSALADGVLGAEPAGGVAQHGGGARRSATRPRRGWRSSPTASSAAASWATPRTWT